ncbi:MAG: hypothetical protein QM758_14595 [Armatimonas sp.]
MSFDKSLEKQAKQLRQQDAAVPEGLRTRILDSLPERHTERNPRQLIGRALILGGIAALACTGLAIAPRFLVAPASAASVESSSRSYPDLALHGLAHSEQQKSEVGDMGASHSLLLPRADWR